MCFLYFREPFLETSLGLQGFAEPLMRGGITGIQGNGSRKLAIGGCELQVVDQGIRQRSMRFCQGII